MPLKISTLLAFTTSLCCLSTATLAQRNPNIPPVSTATSAPLNSQMDAAMFYYIMLGEMQAQSGVPEAGHSFILDQARKTGDSGLYRRAVELGLQARNADMALQAARAWKFREPQSRDANGQLLSVLILIGKPEESYPLLTQQLALTPQDQRSATILQIPALYARVADKKAAALGVEQALQTSLQTAETAVSAWTALGRLRLAADNAPSALEAAQKAHQLDAKAIAPVLLALDLMDAKQSAAEIILRQYLQTPASAPEIRMGYARALMDALRSGEASVQLKRITQDKPDFPDAWLALGVLAVQEGQLDQGDSALKRFLDLANHLPDSEGKERGLTQAYLSLAQIADKRKDYSLSESWLAKVDNPQALVNTQSRRASMLARQGKLQEARELIRKLPERNNGQGEDGAADKRSKLMAEIQLLRDHKQWQAAYDLLAKALADQPKDTDLLYDLATLAEKLKRYDEFERLLRQLIAAKPDYLHAYNALGYSFAERNLRLPEAKELILKALSYAPGDPYITDSLGWVEFRMGNRAEAIRLLEQAFSTKADAEIAAHLGEIYWLNNQRDKALAIWKQAVILNAENETLIETLARLKVKL